MKNNKRGFTLIEVLLAVVIIALLATIAIPSVSGVLNNANNSVDNANARLYENALKIYVSQRAQQRDYVYVNDTPGYQDLVANSIAKIIDDGQILFECKTKGWIFWYNPTTLQVIATETTPGGMIPLTDEDENPIIGYPAGSGLSEDDI